MPLGALGSSGRFREALGGSGKPHAQSGWSGDYRENRRSADENSEHSELWPPPEIFRNVQNCRRRSCGSRGSRRTVRSGRGCTGEILNILNYVGGERCSECSEFRSWRGGFRGSRNAICSVTKPATGFLQNQGRRGESATRLLRFVRLWFFEVVGLVVRLQCPEFEFVTPSCRICKACVGCEVEVLLAV